VYVAPISPQKGAHKHKVTVSRPKFQQLETVAIANGLQLEAARATPALLPYDAMPSFKSLNLSIAVL